jgi:type II secretory pathway pseudopilin PulG
MIRKRAGVTLVELLLYMALSGLVVISMATFLMNMFQARVVTASQTTVQENTRVMLEQITLAVRHGYKVEIASGTLTIFSRSASDNTETVYTIFEHDGQQLKSGTGSDRGAIVPQPMHAPEITVNTFTFEKVSSAIEVKVSATSGRRSATLESTIAFRQL